MNSKMHYLIFAVVAAIVGVPALCETELPRIVEGDLIGTPNPTLAGIDQLCVFIDTHGTDPNTNHLLWQNIKSQVERRLRKAGVQVFTPEEGVMYKLAASSDLKIGIETLKLVDSQRYAFRIQTSLLRAVRLATQNRFHFKADVWATEPVMQVVPAKDMATKITNVVLRQTEVFISSYHAANPSNHRATDAKADSSVSPAMRDAKQPLNQAVAKYGYVASKNSEVFHTPECRWAKRIAQRNLVKYSSRNQAIKAGKRPCKMCKP